MMYQLVYLFYLQQMRPQLRNTPTLGVPQELHKLDDLLDTAPIVQDPPLHIMEIQLKLVFICSIERDGHAAPVLSSHSILVTK